MDSFLSVYPGVLAMMFILAAINTHKLPKFRSEAFLARPAEEQRRSIRTFRTLWIVGAVLCLALSFGIGFVQGYLKSQSEASALQNLIQSLKTESEASDNALVAFEQSMQPPAPDKFLTAEGIAAMRKQLSDWQAAVNRWENSKQQLTSKAEAAIAGLSVSASEREEIQRGFRRSVSTVAPIRSDYVRAKREIAAAIGQKLDFFDARRGRIKVNKSGELVFANAADARQLEAIELRFEAAARREEAAAKRLAERSETPKP